MNKTEHFRLLPRGATILSGALTWLAVAATDITIPRRHWPFCYTSSEQIARLLFTWMKDNVDLHRPILKMISPVIN